VEPVRSPTYGHSPTSFSNRLRHAFGSAYHRNERPTISRACKLARLSCIHECWQLFERRRGKRDTEKEMKMNYVRSCNQ